MTLYQHPNKQTPRWLFSLLSCFLWHDIPLSCLFQCLSHNIVTGCWLLSHLHNDISLALACVRAPPLFHFSMVTEHSHVKSAHTISDRKGWQACMPNLWPFGNKACLFVVWHQHCILLQTSPNSQSFSSTLKMFHLIITHTNNLQPALAKNQSRYLCPGQNTF